MVKKTEIKENERDSKVQFKWEKIDRLQLVYWGTQTESKFIFLTCCQKQIFLQCFSPIVLNINHISTL